MRLLVLSMALAAAGCSQQAPGAPLTDITATNTENTGAFEVVDRTDDDGVVRLRVRAAVPEEADHVARHVLYQALPTARRGVIVEVYPPAPEDAGPIARLEFTKAEVNRPATPPQPSGQQPGAADRQGLPGQRP